MHFLTLLPLHERRLHPTLSIPCPNGVLTQAIKDRELSASAGNWGGDEDSIAWDESMYS